VINRGREIRSTDMDQAIHLCEAFWLTGEDATIVAR